MPTPSVTQVRNALAAMLSSGLSHTILIDRLAEDAVSQTECPAVVVSVGDQSFEPFEYGAETLHTVDFALTIFEIERAGISIADQQNQTVASIAALVAQDRELGGRLQNSELVQAAAPDANAGDIGGLELQLRANWLTPPDDFTTIKGQGGNFT